LIIRIVSKKDNELETCKRKLNEKDNFIETLNISENESRKKLDQYINLNQNYTELKEDNLFKEKVIERLKTINTDCNQKIAKLEEDLEEKENAYKFLEDEKKAISIDLNCLRNLLNKTEEKTNQFYKELDDALKINNDLDTKCSSLVEKKAELIRRLEDLLEEKKRLEINHQKVVEENEILSKNDKEIQMKNYSLQNYYNDYKKAIESLKSLTKIYIHKFGILVNEDIDADFSKSFIMSTNKLTKVFNFNINDEVTVENVKYIEEWVKVVSSEFEVISNI